MHRKRIHRARRIGVWTGLLTVLMLAATPATAQDQMRQHDPEEHLAKLQEELDLTAEQTEQIRTIFAEQHAKFQALRAEARKSRHEALRQHREGTHGRIREILDEQQRVRFDELLAEFQQRHGHGPGSHGDHAPEDGPDDD